MRKFVITLAFGLVALAAQAQTPAPQKIGFADVDYILSQMPDLKQIETELKSLENQLQKQLQAKAQEFQNKLADYRNNINNMPDAVRANTERELTQLQENLEKLQQEAQINIQNKHAQLMEPVYTKVGKAIEDVAKEHGFTYVLNQRISGLDVILYSEESYDVSDLVLKKMGITPKPKEEPKAPGNK